MQTLSYNNKAATTGSTTVTAGPLQPYLIVLDACLAKQSFPVSGTCGARSMCELGASGGSFPALTPSLRVTA